MTSQEVNRRFELLGFEVPETEEQLRQYNEMFKDYPHKIDFKRIDPYKILKDIKIMNAKNTKISQFLNSNNMDKMDLEMYLNDVHDVTCYSREEVNDIDEQLHSN